MQLAWQVRRPSRSRFLLFRLIGIGNQFSLKKLAGDVPSFLDLSVEQQTSHLERVKFGYH